MSSNTKKVEYLNIMRGFAAALMILGHSFIVYPINVASISTCAIITHVIRAFHMETFFLLAGIFYKKEPYKNFIIKKVKRILLPYCVFGTLWIIVHAYGGSLVNGENTISEGIYNFFFASAGYWFLYVLFYMFAFYPFLDYLCKYQIKPKLIIMAVLLIIPDLFEIPIIFNFDLFIHHLPYFILGNCISEYALSEKAEIKSISVRTKIIILCIFAYIGVDVLYSALMFDFTIIFFLRAIAAISVLYVFSLMVSSIKHNHFGLMLKKFLINCSKFSLQIYLFNGYFLVLGRTFICKVLEISNPAIIVISVWAISIFPTLLICLYLLPHLEICSIMCGIPVNKTLKEN